MDGMDGSGIQQQGVFGFGMLPGQGWGGGNGFNPGSTPAGLQMHGSPGGYVVDSDREMMFVGRYHPQSVGMQHQPTGMDPPHSPVGVGVNVTSNLMDPLEAVLGVFPCVKLRGLPFEASAEDVLLFFQGLVVLDVVVLGRMDGKGSGEAFVVFANPMDFQMALQRDRQNMGRRYIEVFQGKRSEYYAAIVLQHQQHNNTTNNSNNSSSNSNNSNNARKNSQDDDGEQTEKSNNTNASGVGWSEKGPTPAQAMAMQGKGGESGSTSQGEGKNKHRGSGGGGSKNSRSSHGGDSGKEHTGYLRMRGLPFSASKKDIIEFFKTYKLIEDSIVFSYRSDGRATGEGYVSFDGPEDAKAAMALHRKTMGSRYIELFISSKEEHRRMMSRSHGR